jgi:hypothetical protein
MTSPSFFPSPSPSLRHLLPSISASPAVGVEQEGTAFVRLVPMAEYYKRLTGMSTHPSTPTNTHAAVQTSDMLQILLGYCHFPAG